MKKMIYVVALALMLTLFVACGNDDDTSANGANGEQEEQSGFTRGTWNGNVFTNSQVGLTFTMPSGWVAATDAEMAELMGIGIDMFDLDFTEVQLDLTGIVLVQDMMASNPETGAMVQIMAERLIFPNNRISAAAKIEQEASVLAEMGMEVNMDFSTINLGGHTWHVFGSAMELMPGFNIYGRYLVDVRDGFAFTIQIVYSELSESVDEILAMFR